MPPANINLPKTARILIEENLLTAELCTSLLGEMTDKSDLLRILFDKKLLDKDVEIAETLARVLRIPLIKLDTVMIDSACIRYISLRHADQFTCIPVRYDKNKNELLVVQSDPLDARPRELLEATHHLRVKVAVGGVSAILAAIQEYFGIEETIKKIIKNADVSKDVKIIDKSREDVVMESIGESEESDLDAKSEPVVNLVNHILFEAISKKASDIHVEPMGAHVKVRNRIDGVLVDSISIPGWLRSKVVARVKILSELNIAERRVPQDGKINLSFRGRNFNIRVSTLPTQYGEKVVMRLLDSSQHQMKLADLTMHETGMESLKSCLSNPQGMIVTTGPTGSGKTTTLYACLNAVCTPEVNIVTIENPIEYRIDGINQVQVNEKAGVTFASVLRSVLRQDPDIILVGEIRDGETAQIAFQAAQTGHLVLSTLHTNDVVSSFIRLFDLGVEPVNVSSSLMLLMAQRLARRACPHCRKSYHPDAELLKRLNLANAGIDFTRGAGCKFCNQIGYSGRIGIYEVLEMNSTLRGLVNARATESQLLQAAVQHGMKTMMQNAVHAILSGDTTVEEICRVIQSTSKHLESCRNCKNLIFPDHVICPFCGVTAKHACRKCGAAMMPEWQICPSCGAAHDNKISGGAFSMPAAPVFPTDAPIPPPPADIDDGLPAGAAAEPAGLDILLQATSFDMAWLLRQIRSDYRGRLTSHDAYQKETQREVARGRRFNTSSACLEVSIRNFDHLKSMESGRCADILNALFYALISSVREIDVISLKDHARIEILLVKTDMAGCEAVLRRLRSKIDSVKVLFDAGNLDLAFETHPLHVPEEAIPQVSQTTA